MASDLTLMQGAMTMAYSLQYAEKEQRSSRSKMMPPEGLAAFGLRLRRSSLS